MPITLINDDERFEADYEGEAKFVLRRLSNAKRQQFVEDCTRRGKVDHDKLGLMTLNHCIISWDGVMNLDGTPAKLGPDTVKDLPPIVVEYLATKIQENLDGGLDPTKTSGSSSEQ